MDRIRSRIASLDRLPSWVTSPHHVSIESPLLAHAKGGNLKELIQMLDDGANINETDGHGNTPIVLSAKYGYEEMLQVLLDRGADVHLLNHDNEDVFKMAVLNKDCNILRTLVRALKNKTRPSQTEEHHLSQSVKSALCEAARLGFCEKIEILSQLHPNMNVCDESGNTIFHYAVKENRSEVIEKFGHILDMNVQNDDDEDSPLHLACKIGSHEAIIALLKGNANVSLSNNMGDNALHCLTRTAARDESNQEKLEQVLNEFIDMWVRLWFKNPSINIPKSQEEYKKHRHQAINALFRETENNDYENVLTLAFKVGSVPLIEVFSTLEDATCFLFPKHQQYDITDVTPRTNTSTSKNKSKRSYLELLIENNPNQTVASVLDLPPYKKIEVTYSSLTSIIYLAVILLHTLYMCLFSYSSVVLMSRNTQNIHRVDVTTIIFYVVVPMEPLVFIVDLVYKFHFSNTTWSRWKYVSPGGFLMQCFSIIHRVVYVFLVAALLYQYATMDMYNTHNTLSVTLLIGWLTTLSFTQGLKPIRFFWRMILHMIAFDVYKVLLVYLFVLLSFSFALHVQIQVSAPLMEKYPTPFHTMFLVFRLMLGMATLFDGNFEEEIQRAGGSIVLPVILYTTYLVLATIVLMNLLIAMMNDSYSNILTNLKLARRVETFQRAINLERTIPWLTKFICKKVIRCGRPDFQNGRFVPADASPEGLAWFVEVEKSGEAREPRREPGVSEELLVTERMTALDNKLTEHLALLEEKLVEIHKELLALNKRRAENE